MMKNRLKWLLVLTVMLCTVCSWAMAADVTVHEMTAQDFAARLDTSEMPAEFVAEYQGETGWLTIVIDAEKTDFKALYASLNGMGGRLKIKPPHEKYTSHGSCEAGYGYVEMEGMIGISYEGPNISSGDFGTWVSAYGSLDETRNMFLPENPTQDDWYEVLLRWMDGDGNEYFEHFAMKTEYKQKKLEPVYLPNPDYVTSEMLAPMQDTVAASDFVAKCEIKDGELHLFLDEFEGTQWLPLMLNAPAGVCSAEIVHDWEGYVTEGLVENGVVVLSDGLIKCKYKGLGSEDNYMVEWKNEEGQTVARNKLTISVVPNDAKPLFNYAQSSGDPVYASLTAVQADQLKITNSAKDCGVETRYDLATGTVYIFREEDAPANGNPGAVTAFVTAPDPSYRYARILPNGGSVIMGNGKYQKMYEDLQYFDAHKVNGNGVKVFSEEPLTRYKAGPVEVYLQDWYVPYGGGAFLIGWYVNEDDEQPAAMQYIHSIVEKMYVESKGELKNKESDITAPVKKITIVKPEKYAEAWDGWELVIRHDPQYGVDANHYELYAVNATGAFQHIDLEKSEEMILYVPYPDGMDMNSTEDFYLYHFNAVYDQKEKLLAEKTPYGLRYVIRSMSPFVQQWVSQTGLAVEAESFGAEDITAALKAAGLDTVAEIKAVLMAAVLDNGGKLDNTNVYDLKLYVTMSDGSTAPAAAENFPMVNGKPALEVALELPDGATKDDDFTVVHMFATNDFGNVAGTTESWTLRPTLDVDGVYRLHFTVTGLSPVMVSWKAEEAVVPDDGENNTPENPAVPEEVPAVPKTGDSSEISLWMTLMFASLLCAVVMLRKKHA